MFDYGFTSSSKIIETIIPVDRNALFQFWSVLYQCDICAYRKSWTLSNFVGVVGVGNLGMVLSKNFAYSILNCQLFQAPTWRRLPEFNPWIGIRFTNKNADWGRSCYCFSNMNERQRFVWRLRRSSLRNWRPRAPCILSTMRIIPFITTIPWKKNQKLCVDIWEAFVVTMLLWAVKAVSSSLCGLSDALLYYISHMESKEDLLFAWGTYWISSFCVERIGGRLGLFFLWPNQIDATVLPSQLGRSCSFSLPNPIK